MKGYKLDWIRRSAWKLLFKAKTTKTINWVDSWSFSLSLENQKIHPANDFLDFCQKIWARFENRENHIWGELRSWSSGPKLKRPVKDAWHWTWQNLSNDLFNIGNYQFNAINWDNWITLDNFDTDMRLSVAYIIQKIEKHVCMSIWYKMTDRVHSLLNLPMSAF